jgi:NADPH2:quinone reductase
MRAAWYDRTGAAADVLVTGELPDPHPGPGEVRVRVHRAGLNPRDVKRRAGLGDRVMTDPRVIPGDDGAGVVDEVGRDVDRARLGERVWVYFANYQRPFGTMADYVVVPADQAVPLPAEVSFEEGACLGIPALTAHRCVHADGPVAGTSVLVTGGAGAVGHYAIELAKEAGAHVIATASAPAKLSSARAARADAVLDRRAPALAEAIVRANGGRRLDRVIDVAFGANLPVSVEVLAANGTVITYASQADPVPGLPFYPLMRLGAVIRLVSVFSMPRPALSQAVSDLNELTRRGALSHPVAARFPLDASVQAHQFLEEGTAPGKVLVSLC